MKMVRIITAALLAVFCLGIQPSLAGNAGPCPRPAAGSEVKPPPDLFSSNGKLDVALNYNTAMGVTGLTLFCFATSDGVESPTLHVNPGETINIILTNQLPPVPGAPAGRISNSSTVCGSDVMTATSVNMHFHGVNTSPKCHSDEVIHTLINSGETFTYKIKIPANEPPGLYWYHPHVHGVSSVNVQGGGSGAIIVEGIENIQPAVSGLPERLLLIRDQPLPYLAYYDPNTTPFWDLSMNYVPVTWPKYTAAIIKMQAGKKEFWRIANASANSILDLQVKYDGKAQPLQVVGLDGVPTGSQDGKRQGTIITRKDLLIPPAGRVEFIVTAPDASVKDAVVVTNHIDSGPAGDFLPERRLAVIQATRAAPHLRKIPIARQAPHRQRFEDLADARVTGTRKLFFDELFIESRQPPHRTRTNPPDNDKKTLFYITVDGQSDQLFDPNNPPAIITERGAVEDWTIENHTTEDHEFHMHQIHFLLLAIDGKPVPKNERQFYDTYPVKYGDGVGPNFPSITVRMDFRGAVVGDFVYHCHILDHEDGGMMAIIRVLPKGAHVVGTTKQTAQSRLGGQVGGRLPPAAHAGK
jgi:FtsP/CotA-like multicopper oxidase with cupredoxin domain